MSKQDKSVDDRVKRLNKKSLLKVSQVSRATGVSTSAINYYVRTGILPPPVKTHRNMAYYDPSYIQMINYVKRLQTQKHLPLRRIKDIMDKKIRIWREMSAGSRQPAGDVFTGSWGAEGADTGDSREKIMAAGARLFSRRGYFAAREEEVIEEAGVPVGDFYQYYSSKEDLLLDIAEEAVRAFRKRISEEVTGESDMLERIRKAIPVSFQFIVENREIYALYMEESVLSDIYHQSKLARFTASIVEDLRNALTRGVENGSIRRVRPDIAANAIMGQLVRLANYWVEDPAKHKMREITREAVEFVTRALQPGDDEAK